MDMRYVLAELEVSKLCSFQVCCKTYKGHNAVVKLLLETGKADVEFRDKIGMTPLLAAAKNGREAIVKLLR
jgi:hypothetical protein